MKNTKLAALLFAGALATQGCAHNKVEKSLDEKVTQQPPVQGSAALRAEAADMIASSTTLSSDQKARLTELTKSIGAQMNEVRTQSLKLRAVLIKDVLESSNHTAEIKSIKKRLKELENRRLSVLFDAIDKANVIMGRQARDNAGIVNDIWQHTGRLGLD